MAPVKRLLAMSAALCVAPFHGAAVAQNDHIQVTVEVRFLEVSDRFLRDVGVDWGSGIHQAQQEAATQALRVALLGGIGTERVLNGIEDDSATRLLTSPTVSTLEGGTASVLYGGPVTYAAQDTGQAVTLDSIGVSIDFRPVVSADGFIMLSVEPTVSEIVPVADAAPGTAPQIDTRRASATVNVRDGETFAIGGLLSDRTRAAADAVAFISEVPLLGGLFVSPAFRNGTTDLVVLVTPRTTAGDAGGGPRAVAIETHVVEAGAAFLDALGIDWPTAAGAAAAPEGLGTDILDDAQLAAILRAAGDDSRVLSDPKATVAHGQAAAMRVGGAVEYVPAGGTESVRFDDVGVSVQLVPFVTPAGDIVLDVSPTVRALVEPPATGIPGIQTRTAHTTAKLRDGQTLAIAGLIERSDIELANRTPALAGIPVLGELFGSRTFQNGRTEFVVLLTPRLAHAESSSGGGTAAAGAEPATTAGAPAAGAGACLAGGELETVALGPKPSALEGAARGIAGGLLGSLSGGVLGSGGESGKTRISRNPLKKTDGATFPYDGGLELNIRAMPSRSGDGMIVAVRANKDAVRDQKLIFADMMIVGPDCMRHQPARRYIYEVTRERKLHISVEFWRWQDGVLVEHWTRAGTKAWSNMLGSGELPVWVGSEFDGVAPQALAQGGWSLAAAFSHEKDGEMFLQPYAFDLLSSQQAASQQPRVPGLGQLPVIGELFRSKSEEEQDELMVFITPRVIQF